KLQSIACGNQSSVFGNLDIERKFPERDSFRRGKTFTNLFGGEVCLEAIFRQIDGQHAKRINPRVSQQPDARFKRCGTRLDALLEMALGVKREHRHTVEVGALVTAAHGVDDGLAVVGALTDPGCAAASADRGISRLSEQLCLEAFGTLLKYRRKRIV